MRNVKVNLLQAQSKQNKEIRRKGIQIFFQYLEGVQKGFLTTKGTKKHELFYSWVRVVIAIFRNFIVIQAKGNKKQIFAKKYQVGTSASL